MRTIVFKCTVLVRVLTRRFGVLQIHLLDWSDIEQWVQAEHNAFFMCDKFEKPQWVELLPAEGPDSDAFDEEFNHEHCQYHASPW